MWAVQYKDWPGGKAHLGGELGSDSGLLDAVAKDGERQLAPGKCEGRRRGGDGVAKGGGCERVGHRPGEDCSLSHCDSERI